MAQEIGKLFRVKKQVQGVVPSTQNSEYFEAINIGGSGNVDQSAVVNTYKEDTQFKTGDILLVEEEIDENMLIGTKAPIPPYYIQFTKKDGTFDDNEEPTNWYKKMYGIDTTWELLFSDESIYFRTEGPLASADRLSNGKQGDAIREIHGTLDYVYTAGAFFAFNIYKESDAYYSLGSQFKEKLIEFKASRQVPVAQENRVINRLIRVYHLLSINEGN